MPAETKVLNLQTSLKSNSTKQSSKQTKPQNSDSDFIKSLEQKQSSKINNQSSQNSNSSQSKSNKTQKNNSSNSSHKQQSKGINDRYSQTEEIKSKLEDKKVISESELKKLKKLLAQTPDKLSDQDLEALLTNLSKILKKISQQFSQDMINKEKLQKLLKSITVNQKQLQQIIKNLNSEQSTKFKSLLKQLNSSQEKLLLQQFQQNNQAANQQKSAKNLSSELQDTVQKLQKLLQETNAKVVKTNSNSNSSQNIANQKILSQFNLVKPKDNQMKSKAKAKSDAAIDLKKLGQNIGQKLIKQENLKLSNSDKQVIDLKTITKKSDKNLDFNNLSNLKLGQFTTDSKVFSQSIATKSNNAKVVDFQKILNQINSKMNFNAVKNGNKITMQLEPDFLGKIQMKVGLDNGTVTARILAESSQVKELLDGNLAKLKSTLQQKGIEIDQFDVSVGYQEEELAEQENSQQQFLFKKQQEKNKLNNFNFKSEDGLSSTETVAGLEEREPQIIADDAVDYMA